MAKLTAIYQNLKPYEVIRWGVANERGFIGYASRYYHDGKSHWYAWHDGGLRAQVMSRKQAVATLEAYTLMGANNGI